MIIANQGENLKDYLNKVPDPKFMPDDDNVIPVLDLDWFEDDITARFKNFLKITFSNETFEEKHLMRHYSITEIDSIAKKHGFEKLINEEWLTANKPSNKTWGIAFVYKNG